MGILTATRTNGKHASTTATPAVEPDVDRLDPRQVEADGVIESIRHAEKGQETAFLLGWYRLAYGTLHREALELRRQLDAQSRALESLHRELAMMCDDNPLW